MSESLEEKLRRDMQEKGYIDRKEFARYLRGNYEIFEKNEEKKSEKGKIKSFFKN